MAKLAQFVSICLPIPIMFLLWCLQVVAATHDGYRDSPEQSTTLREPADLETQIAQLEGQLDHDHTEFCKMLTGSSEKMDLNFHKMKLIVVF